MTQEKEARYHIWTGEDIKAQLYGSVTLPDGSVQGFVQNAVIKKGESVFLDYGSNKMVYTRSGKGFESDFPYGKITLHGSSNVSVVLKSGENQFTKHTTSSIAEFDALAAKQKDRIEKELPLIQEFELMRAIERKSQEKAAKETANTQRINAVNNALGQMDAAFKKPKLK